MTQGTGIREAEDFTRTGEEAIKSAVYDEEDLIPLIVLTSSDKPHVHGN